MKQGLVRWNQSRKVAKSDGDLERLLLFWFCGCPAHWDFYTILLLFDPDFSDYQHISDVVWRKYDLKCCFSWTVTDLRWPSGEFFFQTWCKPGQSINQFINLVSIYMITPDCFIVIPPFLGIMEFLLISVLLFCGEHYASFTIAR